MSEAQRPNIVLVVSHDSGRHLNCYGVPTVNTPHMDSLAQQGVRFAQCFCTAPSCSPSRASIVTGRYPHSNGVMGLTHADFAWDLNSDEKHLAQLLREAGYHTALASFQHESRRPLDKLGFDEVLGFKNPCTNIAAQTAEWFARQSTRQQPFFLELCFVETHRLYPLDRYGHPPDSSRGVTVPPYLVDDEAARDEFAYFQGAVKAMDSAVGTLLQGLKQAGLDQNTIFIFTADHGIPFPRAKCSLYDPGISVSLLMRWLGGQWATNGKPVEHKVSNIDILPTVLELAGLSIPANVQGRSLAPLLQGRSYQPREEIFAEMTYHDYCDPRRCIRTDRYKLIANFTMAPFFMDPSQMWRPNTVTLQPKEPPLSYHVPVELYDLRADGLETKNLVDSPEHQDVLKDLSKRLHDWMVSTGDPLLQGIPVDSMFRRAMESLKSGKLV